MESDVAMGILDDRLHFFRGTSFLGRILPLLMPQRFGVYQTHAISTASKVRTANDDSSNLQ